MSTICIFGDSITWGAYDTEGGGWTERLKLFMLEKINDFDKSKEVDVYNLGVSGEDTSSLLERLTRETKIRTKETKDIVLIFNIGINDSHFMKSQNSLMSPPEKFKLNIEKIIEQAQSITSKIIFIGLTPVEEAKTMPIPWNIDKFFKNENAEEYNQIIKSVCKDKNIYFIEIFDQWIRSDYKKLLEDGLHPNSMGHKKIFETVKDFLIQNKLVRIQPEEKENR